MSLSFMEIQSHYLPIQFATGVVGTCGLGLGYFALRTAMMDDVEEVIVFEQDKRIINFFKKSFVKREGFDKIRFIHGDAREKINEYKFTFDFLYVDIYSTLLSNQIPDDIKLFKDKCNAYHFWGLERVILDAIEHEIIHPKDLDYQIIQYLQMWQSTPYTVKGSTRGIAERLGEESRLANMYQPLCEPEYAARTLQAMGYAVREYADYSNEVDCRAAVGGDPNGNLE
jgi:hypothetical protein